LREAAAAADRVGRSSLPLAATEVAPIVEAYRNVIATVCQLPGLERFLSAPDFDDIVAAVGTQEALAYIITAPQGGIVLLVTAGSDEPDVLELSDLTSTRVIHALMQLDDTTGRVVGYLAAQAGGSSDLDEEIAKVSELLGPEMLEPLATRLAEIRVRTVCLVPVGLLGLLPLGALSWPGSNGPQCLLDQVDVVVVPSARTRAVSRRRARHRHGQKDLLVVGNPLPHTDPLPGAELEASVVAATLRDAPQVALLRTAATKDAVIAALPGASIVHLACHGMAGVDAAALDSGLSLARNEVLSAAEILELAPLRPAWSSRRPARQASTPAMRLPTRSYPWAAYSSGLVLPAPCRRCGRSTISRPHC
jgi:CHAT domain-containing protein